MGEDEGVSQDRRQGVMELLGVIMGSIILRR